MIPSRRLYGKNSRHDILFLPLLLVVVIAELLIVLVANLKKLRNALAIAILVIDSQIAQLIAQQNSAFRTARGWSFWRFFPVTIRAATGVW